MRTIGISAISAALVGVVLALPVAAMNPTSRAPASTGYPILDVELSRGDHAAFAALVAPLNAPARARFGAFLNQLPLYHRGAVVRALLDMKGDTGRQAVAMFAGLDSATIPALAKRIAGDRPRWDLLGDLVAATGPTAGTAILLGTTPETACAVANRLPQGVGACQKAGRYFVGYGQLPYIYGGYVAPFGTAPWQVQIFAAGRDAKARPSPNEIAKDIRYYGARRDNWEHHHICGSVWLGNRWVLTAAHCVRALDGEAYFFDGRRVRVGTDDIAAGGQIWRIESLVRHGQYRNGFTRLGHDIALLRLAPNPSGVAITPVAPVALASRPFPPGTELQLTGWGATDDMPYRPKTRPADAPVQSYSQRLKVGPLVLRAADDCTKHRNYDRYGDWTMMPGQLCAGGPSHIDKEIDACQGDSGGPLVARRDGAFQLVGLVSFGPSCGLPDTPGVYTNVAYYAPWIAGAMQQARPSMIIDWVPGRCRRNGKPIACIGTVSPRQL